MFNRSPAHSQTVTVALFLLTQNPDYIEPLRMEIQSAIEEGGWTKASFGQMWKLDSFLKEMLRRWSLGIGTQAFFSPLTRDIY